MRSLNKEYSLGLISKFFFKFYDYFVYSYFHDFFGLVLSYSSDTNSRKCTSVQWVPTLHKHLTTHQALEQTLTIQAIK